MKKLKLIIKLISFVTSYFPLWTLLFIKFLFLEDKNGNFILGSNISIGKHSFNFPLMHMNLNTYVMAGLCIFSLFLSFLFIKIQSKKINNRKILTVLNVENEDSSLLSYIFSYVVIFLDIGGSKDIFIKILYILFIFYYYSRGDILMYNPSLSFFKYNLLKVKTKAMGNGYEKEKTIYVITKDELNNLEDYNFRNITDNIYFL